MFGVVPPTPALYYAHYFDVNMKRRKKDKYLMLNLVYCICVGSTDLVFRVFYSDPNPNASSTFHTAKMYFRPKG